MASSIFFFFTILSFSALSSVYSDTDTIRNTCKTTKYYDLCVSSLESDPKSSTADEKGLAAILLGVGMANATATASFISEQIQFSANDTVLKKALKDCADKYSFAGDALEAAIGDLENEAYDYTYMHVMAAAAYPNSCRNGFRRFKGLVYPAEIGRREVGLRRICEVVLGIIDHIGF